MEATIEVTGLRKRFGPTVALDGISFLVAPGQVTGFVGPNGAGKSTTMRVILGLDAADEGSALVDGQRYNGTAPSAQPRRLPPRRRSHTPGPQRPQSPPVARQLSGPFSSPRRPGARGTPVSRRWLVARPEASRSGMRQRLGIAAALLGDPSILILDEPFNGMDPEGHRLGARLSSLSGRPRPSGVGLQSLDERAARCRHPSGGDRPGPAGGRHQRGRVDRGGF